MQVTSPSFRLNLITALTLLSLPILWGSAFNLITLAVKELSPMWVVAGRLSLGAVLVLSYLYARGGRLPPLASSSARLWLFFLIIGCLGTVIPFFFLGYAQQTISSGMSGLFIATMPLVTIGLAHFFVGERMSLRKFAGFIIGFLGVVLLMEPWKLSGFGDGIFLAQLTAMGAAVCYACAAIITKRAPPEKPSVFAAGVLVCAACVSLCLAFLEGLPESRPSFIALAAVLGLGLGSTALGTFMYVHIIQSIGPSALAMVNYLTPVVAILFGVIFLEESLPLSAFGAFAFIMLGMFIARPGKNRPTQAVIIQQDPGGKGREERLRD